MLKDRKTEIKPNLGWTADLPWTFNAFSEIRRLHVIKTLQKDKLHFQTNKYKAQSQYHILPLQQENNYYVLACIFSTVFHYFRQFNCLYSPLLLFCKNCPWSNGCYLIYEPPHDKTNKVTVPPVKIQISLGVRPVWSESSLSAWRKLGSLATHWVHSEDSDQTGRMPRLIWVFAGRTLTLLVLSWGGSYHNWTLKRSQNCPCFPMLHQEMIHHW